MNNAPKDLIVSPRPPTTEQLITYLATGIQYLDNLEGISFWIWVAIEPKRKSILDIYLSAERTMFVAEHFLQNLTAIDIVIADIVGL